MRDVLFWLWFLLCFIVAALVLALVLWGGYELVHYIVTNGWQH